MFKVGDRVRFKQSIVSKNRLDKDRVYIVQHVYYHNGYQMVEIMLSGLTAVYADWLEHVPAPSSAFTLEEIDA
jgi:hypothetical protein